MAELVADKGVKLALMHALGDPKTMQDNPRYDNVVDDINNFFAERLQYSTLKGIDASNIYIDPGIGFGKTLDHNLEILRLRTNADRANNASWLFRRIRKMTCTSTCQACSRYVKSRPKTSPTPCSEQTFPMKTSSACKVS